MKTQPLIENLENCRMLTFDTEQMPTKEVSETVSAWAKENGGVAGTFVGAVEPYKVHVIIRADMPFEKENELDQLVCAILYDDLPDEEKAAQS